MDEHDIAADDSFRPRPDKRTVVPPDRVTPYSGDRLANGAREWPSSDKALMDQATSDPQEDRWLKLEFAGLLVGWLVLLIAGALTVSRAFMG